MLDRLKLGKGLTAGPVEARGCLLSLTPGPACSEALWEILRHGESMASDK